MHAGRFAERNRDTLNMTLNLTFMFTTRELQNGISRNLTRGGHLVSFFLSLIVLDGPETLKSLQILGPLTLQAEW